MKTLKKISLHNIGDIMHDSEMKRIFGGIGTCGAYLPEDKTYYVGTVTSDSYSHSPEAGIWRGISYAEAMGLTRGIKGAKWCCDNCAYASWY